MTFYILGIPNKIPSFTETEFQLLKNHRIFSGGQRHYELVKSFLPQNHEWIFIKAPMQALYAAYEAAQEPIVVFASGNPLFYGMANTLQRKFPKASFTVLPYFSSIQVLANKAMVNSNDLRTVSVHGRTWKALDEAMIQQLPLIGVLTDTKKNPKEIAQRLLMYGYCNYQIIVGENLEGTKEKIYKMSLEEAAAATFASLNCILLHKVKERKILFGIPNAQFEGLQGRPNMITKMPIRLTTLHFLEIQQRKVLWDIGFCTGSVSIEAKLRNPRLEVIAFEKREECAQIMHANCKRFGVFEITSVMGDFFEKELSKYPLPDTVFIGGHGGKLALLIEKVSLLVAKNTCLVINTVKRESLEVFEEACKKYGFHISEKTNIVVDSHNPIHIIKAVKS